MDVLAKDSQADVSANAQTEIEIFATLGDLQLSFVGGGIGDVVGA